jgi:putative MATE family efflux protein
MEQTNSSFLATENVGTLMRKYAIPCIISLLVAALYNIVDQIFIANADYLGSYGNAANTVVFPLTVIALAIAVMIGDGCCAFVSLSLGKKRPDDANRSVGNAVTLTIVCGILLCAIYLLFQEPIITMFGGTVNEETFHHSKEYFFYISLGIPFYMFGQSMNPVIRADGSPKFAMVSTLAGAVINIILDPIFIFVCRWGMMGAAVATVIGQFATAVLAIWYLAHTKTVHLSPAEFKLNSSIAGHSLTLGICSFLSQISLVAAMAAINNMVRHYGALDAIFGQEQYAQIPMAVVGIVMKFFQIVISIVVGMAAGCIPIVGFNMGAGLKQRVKNLFTRLLLTEAAVGVVALLIVELLPRQLIAIFGAANESVYYTDFAVKAFRIYLCMIIFACVNKAAFIFLQAMGKAVASTALSMIREIVFGVGFALLLPRFFGLDGVLYSMPVSDILTAIVSAILIAITYKQLDKETETTEQKKEVMVNG